MDSSSQMETIPSTEPTITSATEMFALSENSAGDNLPVVVVTGSNKLPVHSSFVKAHLLKRYIRYLRSSDRQNDLIQLELAENTNDCSNDAKVNQTSARTNFNMENPNSTNNSSNNNVESNNNHYFRLTGAQLVIKLNVSLSSQKTKSNLKDKSQGSYDYLIFLAMPCGKYPVELYQHQRRLQTNMVPFLEKWILGRKLYSFTGCINLVCIPEVKHSFFIGVPLLLKSLEKFRIFLKFAVCQRIMDDFMIKSAMSGQIPFLPPVFFKDLRKIITNILSSQYRHVDAVPYFEIPLFHHCLTALFQVHQEIRESVGYAQYEKYHGLLLQEMMDWVEWHKIKAYNFCYNDGSRAVGERYYSQKTHFESLRFFRGRGAILEVIQLLHGASLDNSLRRLKVFELFCDTAVVTHTMAMDAFTEKATQVNQSVIDGINDAIVDFQRIGESLQREYMANERVLRFLKNAQCFVDGGIRAFVEDWKCGLAIGTLSEVKVYMDILKF